jgi:hypothetical protein
MELSSGQIIPAFSGHAAICVGIIFALQSFLAMGYNFSSCQSQSQS